MWWNSMSTLQQVMFIIACAATFILIVQIVLMLVSGATDADVSAGGATDFDGSTEGMLDAGDAADFDGSVGGGVTDVGGEGGGFSSIFDGTDGGISQDMLGGVSDSDANDLSSRGSSMPFGLRLLSLRSIIAFLSIGCWVGYTLCYSTLPVAAIIVIAVACGFLAACGVAGAIIGMEKLQSNGNIVAANAVGKIGTVYLTIPAKRAGFGKVNILVQERYAEYNAITDGSEPIPTAAEIRVVGHVGANVLLVEKYRKPAIVIENRK